MFKDLIACYEAIAQEAAGLLDGRAWSALRIECELDGNSADMVFEVVDGTGHKDYLTRSSRLPECFIALARMVSAPDKGLYKVCRFSLLPDGKYSAEFDY
jgi:hypothetical protein